jgi:Ca2+:H+ antiporter
VAKQSTPNSHVYDIAICIFAIFGFFPISERLGYVNRQLSLWSVSGFVGLLTSLLNNISIFFLALLGLVHNLPRLTQLCLLGSILINLSLVLGLTFFLGGLVHFTQKYNKIAAQVNATLLIVGTMAIIFPTLLTSLNEENRLGEVELARYCAAVLFLMFAGTLYFQVRIIEQ